MQELLNDLHRHMSRAEIPPEKIPDIDLYMDQITTLLDVELEENKRTDKDKIMTKTMINNYSKDGLLKRIKGKKYSKEHILMMLIIYNFKQSMSVQDIGRIIDGLNPKISGEGERYNPQEVDRLYRCLLDTNHNATQSLPEYLGELIGCQAQDETDRDLRAIIALCTVSALCQNASQRLIDKYYPTKNI